jgi:hypothetical protein
MLLASSNQNPILTCSWPFHAIAELSNIHANLKKKALPWRTVPPPYSWAESWAFHFILISPEMMCPQQHVRPIVPLLYIYLSLLAASATKLMIAKLWKLHGFLTPFFFCWLFAFVFSFGCVYSGSRLPCTFDGWVHILDFYIQVFLQR